jgi:SPP1 gp7 family putative phage head morphogenesis protein
MIPEFRPEDYDQESNIPEDLLAILLLSIPKFEKARIETLIENAAKSYLKGEQEAFDLLNMEFDPEEAKDAATTYLKTYQTQIREGYTVIQGEKVYWLRDRTLNERQKIFDIISDGIKNGRSPDTVKSNFMDYFKMQKSQAESIARTETAYVQARGAEIRFKKQGVEKVKWLLGPDPCEVCIPIGGKIFTWDTLPYQIPVHVRCTCSLSPVIEND